MKRLQAIAAALAFAAGALQAAPPPITLRPVITGLEFPTEIAHARDGTRRLFIAERAGRVRIWQNGALVPQPFLDIGSQVSTSGERGLIGLAFDPRYRYNGKLYVMYTTMPDDANGGALRVSQFLRSTQNPSIADPASEKVVIEIPHPGASNHNGGKLSFAYGLLHVAAGDGGGGGDPGNNAQNWSSPLGKILRLCVDCSFWNGELQAGFTFGRAEPPDAGQPVLLYGLRNPWRFSFDRQTGDMYLGDVGQATVEEIDFLGAADARLGGQDFGWRVLEGNNCFNPATPGCEAQLASRPDGVLDHRRPVLTYLHDSQGGNSVTGGYVYRGLRSSQLQGYYIYGDFGSSRIWAARRENGVWSTTPVSEAPNGISGLSTFGEDEEGELYVANMIDGIVYAIEGPVDPVVPRNVALATAGAIATPAGTATNFPASAAIDGDRLGNYWGGSNTWAGGLPSTLQVDFDKAYAIDRIVMVGYVYEFPGKGYEPFETTRCSFAPRDFDVMARAGGAWQPIATVRGNELCIRSFDFPAVEADAIAVRVLAAAGGNALIVELEAWTSRSQPRNPNLQNVALATAGATASASSTYGSGFLPDAAINGDRAGRNWGGGSGWNDATSGAFPDWLQVDFAGRSALEEVVVYSLQDDPFNPVEPSDAMTFARYGLVDFTVEGWNGTDWIVLATVTDNNRVKRRVTFTPFDTQRIRVNVSRALDAYSHVVEVEAFGTPLASTQSTTNYALASMGATASASSTYGGGFAPSAAIDGVRASSAWGAGSGWNDGTLNAFPDVLQVDLSMPRTLDHVVVYTLQDNPFSPSEPTEFMTFTRYGIVDFTVEGWNGSSWAVLGTVTNNNLVKRAVSFVPFTTGSIRINVTRALGGYSHITEVEAFGF